MRGMALRLFVPSSALVVSIFIGACGPTVATSETDSGATEAGSTTGATNPTTGSVTSTPGTAGTSTTTPATTPLPPTTDATSPEATESSSGDESSGADTLDCPAGDFIPPGECEDDCYRPIPGCVIDPIECSVWDQDCPEAEKCNAWSNNGDPIYNAARCVPMAAKPDLVGEPCEAEGSKFSGVDTCELGARCWGFEEFSLAGTCVAMCGGSAAAPSCADPDAICLVANGEDVINLCVPRCDPLGTDCDAGLGCYPIDGGFACLPPGVGLLPVAENTCALLSECEPGTACTDDASACLDGAEPCCAAYCDLAAPVCAKGLSCADVLAEPSVGLCQAT